MFLQQLHTGQIVEYNDSLEIVLGIYFNENTVYRDLYTTNSVIVYTYTYSKNFLQKSLLIGSLHKRKTIYLKDIDQTVDNKELNTWLLKNKLQRQDFDKVFDNCVFDMQPLLVDLIADYNKYLEYIISCKELFQKPYQPVKTLTVGEIYNQKNNWYIYFGNNKFVSYTIYDFDRVFDSICLLSFPSSHYASNLYVLTSDVTANKKWKDTGVNILRLPYNGKKMKEINNL